jgi:Ser/Thr protein kinase RdoA (MazF antagonist)
MKSLYPKTRSERKSKMNKTTSEASSSGALYSMTHCEHLPILRSILASEALTRLVEETYGLTVTRIQLIKAVVLDTYRVWTSAGLYILRVYPGRRRTLGEIHAELELLTYLHAHDAPISIPVVQRNGERLLAIQAPEGTRYAVLFTYAPGEPLGENLAAIRTYGYTLAHIHAIADALPPTLARTPLDLAFLLERPLEHLINRSGDLTGTLGQRSRDWAFLQQVADVISPQIAALPSASPCYGYCHGDACSNNAHVAADGQVTLFDFDFCGLGWRAYDLATFLSGESPAVADAFLQGYEEVRLLLDEERTALPLFQIAQSIWMLGTRASYINEWGEIHFTNRFIDRVLDSIRTVVETIK